MTPDEFDLLVERYLSGAAEESEVRRLEEILKGDPEARRSFLQSTDQDVSLRKLLSIPVPEACTARPASRRGVFRRRPRPVESAWRPVAIGAALFAACLLLLLSREAPVPRRAMSTPSPVVRSEPEVAIPRAPSEGERRALDRLAEIDRERKALVDSRPRPEARLDPEVEKVGRERLDRLDEEARKIEEDFREAARQAREGKGTPAPAAPPTGTVTLPESVPPSGVVLLEEGVDVLSGPPGVAGRPVAPGTRILPGQRLETSGPRSSATLAFQDGTRLYLGPQTEVADLREREEGRGKRVSLLRGTLQARVVRQPPGLPAVLVTPHGEARVVGTAFRLVVEPGQTRLEVTEGKVTLRRKDGKSVDVSSGHMAVAQPVGELSLRPLPIEEILLLPNDARAVGGEWKVARDPLASTGQALEALETAYKVRKVNGNFAYDSIRNRTAYLVFTFQAEAGKDYHLWIRGRTMATQERELHDEVAVEPVGGQLSQKCRQLGPTGDNAFCYTGYSIFPAYGWIGGYGEDGTSDTVPLSIRFSRPGLQTIKVYAIEAPIRIDGLWLSTTQSTRPLLDQRMPVRDGK